MTTNLAPRSPDALARPLDRPGFLDGTRALFAGFGFILRTPAAWPLALVPVAVASLGTILLGVSASAFVVPKVTAALAPRSAILATAAEILAVLLLLILAALAGMGIAQPLSGPALNRIVRRVEAEIGAPPWPDTGFVEDVSRALQSMLIGYAFGLPLLAVLALVTFFFPPAAVVTFPLKLVVLALLFAWDFCDYPLSIHGLPVAARISLVARHARVMIGFGLGIALLSLIPCAPLFVLPIGVAGAARLMRQIERWEEGQRR
ncbi:MAG: EI24 domain-containing protein [Minicystis sp.]